MSAATPHWKPPPASDSGPCLDQPAADWLGPQFCQPRLHSGSNPLHCPPPTADGRTNAVGAPLPLPGHDRGCNAPSDTAPQRAGPTLPTSPSPSTEPPVDPPFRPHCQPRPSTPWSPLYFPLDVSTAPGYLWYV